MDPPLAAAGLQVYDQRIRTSSTMAQTASSVGSKVLTEAAIRADMEARIDAIKRLESQYPEYDVVLVPKGTGPSDPVQAAPAGVTKPSSNGSPNGKHEPAADGLSSKTNRQIIAEICRGKWMSREEIEAAT